MIKNITLGILLGVFLYSCTKDKGPIEPEIIITTVSFETDIQPIFNAQCISCHNTANNQYFGYLDLSNGIAYTDLVNVESNGYAPSKRVVPEDIENSVLWKKINNSEEYGDNMPLGGNLSTTEKETIKVWINEGALNN